MVKMGRPGVAFRGRYPNRIREIRERERVTQEELALRIGSNFQAIGKIERGETRLRLDHIVVIAQALRCHPAELVPDVLMLTDKQSALLQVFDLMNAEDQDRAVRMLTALVTPSGKRA